MIIEITRPSRPELFESYDDLFKCLDQIENLKMLAPTPDFKGMDWSFTLYNPEQVRLLFDHMKEDFLPIKEACEQGLSLFEICSGDFGLPEYVALTPMLNVGYLKKKWALNYCACHGITVTEKA